MRPWLLAGASTLAFLSAAPAFAQGETNATQTIDVGEVVVTAERRATKLLETSASITAVDGSLLTGKTIAAIADLQTVVPSLSVSGTNLLIRGIGSNVLTADSSPGVGLHIDGVYMGRQYAVLENFYDVERVEVLRGPQGTLYGRNATGGVVNIITRKPGDTPEGSLEVSAGNHQSRDYRAMLSGPLAEGVLLRGTFLHSKRDGRIRNIFPNRMAADDRDELAGRLQLIARLTDRLELELKADAQRNDDHGLRQLWQAVAVTGAALPSPRAFGGAVPDLSQGVVNLNDPIGNRFRGSGLLAKLNWHGDRVAISSLTSYRRTEFSTRNDFDGSPISYGYLSRYDIDQDQWSQELNLSSLGDGPLQWVTGAYFFREDVENFTRPELSVFRLSAPVTANLATESYALYGQVKLSLAPQFDVTVGARYSTDRKSLNQIGNQFGRPIFDDVSKQWNSFTPKLTLTYHAPGGWISYATASRGFKSGGFNVAVSGARDFNPEKVWNYEVGVKGRAFDNHIEFSANAFNTNYSDLQVFAFAAVNTIVQNAAKARIQGFELESRLFPTGTSKFSIDLTLAYLDAKYRRFLSRDEMLAVTRDVAGNQLENTPKLKANVRVQYTADLGPLGRLTPLFSYTYQDRIFFRPENDAIFTQGAFGLLNASLDYVSADDRWSASAYVRNATDRRHVVNSSLIPTTQVRTVGLGEPRTFGARLGYRF